MKLDSQFQIALEHFQKGEVEKAEELCLQILEIDANHAETLNLMGGVAFKKGAIEEAISFIQKAIEQNPDKAPIYSHNLALAYTVLGNIPAASSILKTAAETLLGKGNEKEALTTFEKAAFLLRDYGQLDEAKHLYHRMLSIEPRLAGAYNDLGLIFQHERNYEVAASHFKKALEIEPNSAFSCNNLGINYQMQQKPKEAIVLFEKALELDPNLVEAHINLGNYYRGISDFVLAEKHCKKALELVPDHPGIHNNLGILLHTQGKLEEAIKHYSRALELDPQFSQAEQNLNFAKQDLTSHIESATTVMGSNL